MLEQKNLKRITILILIISLIYATVYPTIFGLISYAQESEETAQEKETKLLEIEVPDFSKNNMQEETTEYQEKLTLTPTKNDGAKSIEIADIKTSIEKNTEDTVENQEENSVENNTKVFYTSTKIDKLQILEAFQTGGNLEITYKTEEEITENEETVKEQEEKKLEKWEIEAKEGKAIIDRETDTDENGFITVIYPKNTTSISIKLNTDISKIEKIEIVNNKTIEKVEDVNLINTLRTAKDLIVEKDNEKISTQEELVLPIYYTRTFAELGIDKNKLATGVENKINFTITLHTEKEIYDLYQNSYFMIELPKEIKTIDIDEAIILNNTYIENSSMDLTTLENGNKAIVMKLEGTQKEYTSSMQENIQIAISARVTTEGFIPTTQEQINLYYTNENATTYNGVEKGENGFQNTAIELVSNKEVMVDSKVLFGDNSISSRETQNTIVMKPNSYENVTIIGTAINNVGTDIQNAKILGTATNMGPISGVEKVYYTENPDANTNVDDANNKWTETYTANAKKFLIVLDEFKQAQTVTFGYYMYLPQNAEEDTELEASFEVYDNNNQILNISKEKILQEARNFNIYEDEQIKTQITIAKEDIVVGEKFEETIEITNKTNETISGMEVNINLPENLERKNATIESNGESVKALIQADSNLLIAKNLNINPNATVVIKLTIKANEVKEPSQKMIAAISYNNKKESIFDRAKIIEKPQTKIDALISSNKSNQTLKANETVEYKITLTNSGDAKAIVDVIMPELENLLIQKMESINVATGKTVTITSGNLEGKLHNISINSGEKVEICVRAVAKELESNETEVIYANIVGDNIEEITTNKIINNIQEKGKEKITDENTSTNDEQKMSAITGIAWIDENENGQKDLDEKLLTGIEAVLINTKTSEEVAKETTNNKGEYIFNNIPEGNYVVIFNYNKDEFSVTNYANRNSSNNLESNIVNTTQNNETIAKTEVLKLKDGNTESINAGFITNKKSDIKISNKINKITVYDDNGITLYNFEKSKMPQIVKLDDSKQEEMTLVEYEFKIVNNGEAEGYITPITEQIPEGMKFASELNTDWYEGNDGNVYLSALINKKIKPGEEIAIKLVLTKEQKNK